MSNFGFIGLIFELPGGWKSPSPGVRVLRPLLEVFRQN